MIEWFGVYRAIDISKTHSHQTHTHTNTHTHTHTHTQADGFIKKCCCFFTSAERLSDFDVRVLPNFTTSSPNAEQGALCAHHKGVAGAIVTIPCAKKPRGALVMIQIPGIDKVLQLCEVEVHPTIGDCEYRNSTGI